MTPKENLKSLRSAMKQQRINAYIITMYDPHLSEYVAEHWKIIKWFSGFSGSAGNIVVTQDFAGLWTDSRYFIQAAEQLEGSGIELVKLKIPHTPEFIDWIAETLPENSKIAFDGRLVPVSLVKKMYSSFGHKSLSLIDNVDLISNLWTNRPSLPKGNAFVHDLKFAGKSRPEKLKELRLKMNENGIDYQIISNLDDIAWLFNIRGTDVNFVPLVISYAVISAEKAYWFVDKKKVPAEIEAELKSDNIDVNQYENVFACINDFTPNTTISTEFAKTNYAVFDATPEYCHIQDQLNITTRLKAIKNYTEIKNIKTTMVKDGVAMVNFLYWLDNNVGKEVITEMSASEKLRDFRAEQEGFFQESFGSISGYNAHAAMPHYSATPETDVELKASGIYLIDSGGQYYGGTTDITRTVSLGNPTQEQKDDYTLALRGTIDLSMVVFPEGTKGFQLDAIARKPLWDNKMNYGHGTGHGVGFFLNVHEGPQSISTSASGDMNTILTPGMIISDEPAFYRQGKHGFRTENLVLVVEDEKNEFGQFYKFETVTLCPIDTKLINKDLMTRQEVNWLNEYHNDVFIQLSPHISDEKTLNWLKGKTKAI